MGILFRKHDGFFRYTGIAKLSFIVIILGLASSLIDTIWAVYIDGFVNSSVSVGLISACLTIISFFSYFVFVPFIEGSSKSKIFSNSLILFASIYLLFAVNREFSIFLFLAIIITSLYTLRITSLGIIIKDYSSEKNLARNEGLIYTFVNTAWVVGPLIAALLLSYLGEKTGITSIFISSAVLVLLAFFIFKISRIKDSNVKKRIDTHIFRNFVDYFRSKDRVISYILGGGVAFWWTLIYLFVPLYIIRNGLPKSYVGYFLFAVAFLLIIFTYKFSKLAGKFGFKKMFHIGYGIVFLLCLSCFFISNIFYVLGLLVLASVGMAMLESTSEAYFFDLMKKKQELRFYGPHNTTLDTNRFVARLLASILLIYLPFNYIFLMFSAFMLFFFFFSFRMRNIIERKKDGRRNRN